MKKSYPPRSSQLLAPHHVPRPVVGIDIDGTIGEYHLHFENFARMWLGQPERHPCELKYSGTVSFAKYLGVSKSTYRKMKLAYRKGGFKRWMPVREDAAEMVTGIRDRGAEIVICTTRPYLSLENVDEDTREWLRRNDIPYDHIIWGEHKYRNLVSARGSLVQAVVEDLPALSIQAAKAGIPNVLMMDSPYAYSHDELFVGTQGVSHQLGWEDQVSLVDDCYHASVELHRIISEYERKNFSE